MKYSALGKYFLQPFRSIKTILSSSVSVSVQSLSHVQLCSPMNCSMLGFPVHHKLPELTQTHVHRVSDAIQPSHPLSSPLLPPLIFPNTRSFQMSQFFSSGGQSIGVSASPSVLPMNIQSILQDGLVWSPCSPRDSQESSPRPWFKIINCLKIDKSSCI